MSAARFQDPCQHLDPRAIMMSLRPYIPSRGLKQGVSVPLKVMWSNPCHGKGRCEAFILCISNASSPFKHRGTALLGLSKLQAGHKDWAIISVTRCDKTHPIIDNTSQKLSLSAKLEVALRTQAKPQHPRDSSASMIHPQAVYNVLQATYQH
eukprot:464897-Pelagomonas_calceolata.AAC.1